MNLIYLSQSQEWNNSLVDSKEQILVYKKDFVSGIDSDIIIKKIKLRFLPFFYLRITFGPAINYGNDKEFQSLLIQLKKIAKAEKAVFLEFNPYVWEINSIQYKHTVEKFEYTKAHDYVFKYSVVVDLNLTEDDIFSHFERRGQKAIRQSVARGVSVEKVLLNEENFDKFYDLYKNTCSRTMFIPESYELLKKQMIFWGKKEKVFLFFARDESIDPIGVLLLFSNGDAVSTVYQGNNYNPEIINKRASNALYWESLKWAKKNGFKYYDFGGITISESIESTEKKEGIQNFKMQFGGKVVSLPGNYMYVNRKILYRIINLLMPLYSKIALSLAKKKSFGK